MTSVKLFWVLDLQDLVEEPAVFTTSLKEESICVEDTILRNVKPVPSPEEADDVAVTSFQSLMPCRDRYLPTVPSSILSSVQRGGASR